MHTLTQTCMQSVLANCMCVNSQMSPVISSCSYLPSGSAPAEAQFIDGTIRCSYTQTHKHTASYQVWFSSRVWAHALKLAWPLQWHRCASCDIWWTESCHGNGGSVPHPSVGEGLPLLAVTLLLPCRLRTWVYCPQLWGIVFKKMALIPHNVCDQFPQ